LRWLSANDVPVADLKPLAGMAVLRDLSLPGTRVGDLKPLYGLKGLAFVTFTRGKVAAAEVEALTKALPDVRVSLW
jgi:hypothetical protein